LTRLGTFRIRASDRIAGQRADIRNGYKMRSRLTLLCLGSWCACVALAGAQSLTINGGTSFHAGAAEDFASTVIGDPWDFENPDDYSYRYPMDVAAATAGQSTFQNVPDVANGLLHGVLRGSSPRVNLQFEGIRGAFNQVGRTGIRYPIDANRYTRISFRLKRSV